MKAVHYKNFGAALVLAAVCASAACTESKSTQLVAGFKTQVQVPRDLKSVVIKVTSGSNIGFCQAYPVTRGKAELPQSLGTLDIQLDQELPVEILVVGLTTGIANTGRLCPNTLQVGKTVAATDLGTDADGAPEGQVRVFRRSVQQYVPGRAIYIPMPIWYACFDRDCENSGIAQNTCKAGICMTGQAALNATYTDFVRSQSLKLADTNETSPLLKGEGNTCFRSRTADGKPGCFDVTVPPKVIDAAKCIFEVSEIPNLPFRGVNVEAIFESGFVKEVLDLDADEGFFLPDPANPRRFQLAEGLCDAYNNRKQRGLDLLHPITAINASGACPSKTVVQPLCYDEEYARVYGAKDGTPPPTTGSGPGTRVAPSPTGLVILFDRTQENQSALKTGGIADQLVRFALQDASLNTVSMGMMMLPGLVDACQPGFTPAIAPGEAGRKAVGDQLNTFIGDVVRVPKSNDIGLASALKDAYTALGANPDFDRRAVVVLGNGPFSGDFCDEGTPLAAVRTLRNVDPKVAPRTYVVLTEGALPGEQALADEIAREGRTNASLSGDTQAGLASFFKVATDLTACRYDASKIPADADTVAYYDRVNNKEIAVSKNSTCTEATGAGWNVDGKYIQLCKESCDALKQNIERGLALALATGSKVEPVDVWVRKK
jgi:hypothetical protein